MLVYDFDRFGREGVTTLADYETLERLGIEVHDSLIGYIDHETAARKAVEAHNEVRKTSRRVMDNLMERHMNSEDFDSPRRPPAGYRRNPVTGVREPDPEWVKDGEHIITSLFRRFDAGETEASLRTWYNSVTGRRARTNSITGLLRNEYYCGVDAYNKRSRSKIQGDYAKPHEEWSTRLHDHPLIDRATFARVQARLDAHSGQGQRRMAGARHSLNGLVRCAACTFVRHGQEQHVALRGLTHKTRVEIQCPVCQRGRVYGRVEAVVQQALRAIPLGRDDIMAGRGDPTDVVARAQALGVRIEKVRARRGRLINRHELEPGDPDYLDDEDYRAAMAESKRELEELEQQRTALLLNGQEAVSDEVVLRWLGTLSDWTAVLAPEDTTPEERRTVYSQVIKASLLDFDQNTLTISWLPPIARILGQDSLTLPVPKGQTRGPKEQTAGQRSAGRGTA